MTFMGTICKLSEVLPTLHHSFQLTLFQGHSGAVTTMATDAVGKILYTAGADATVRSWNISTGQILKVKFDC